MLIIVILTALNLMLLYKFAFFLRSEHLDFTEEMERLRVLRGKGKPARDAKKKNKKVE